ncbi:hypothetical protein DMUE_2591 [Dictyocoela muelleri]|nr:hypothetical protein DMUE_2591 [Dictyocoela muelleri]
MFKRLNKLKDHEFFKYISDNAKIIQLFQVLDIIPYSKNCLKCEKPMKMENNKRYNIGFAFKFSKCKCVTNLWIDSILAGTKISPFVFFKICILFFFQKLHFTKEYEMVNCGIGEEMYAHIILIFRKRISEYLIKERRQLGGVSERSFR